MAGEALRAEAASGEDEFDGKRTWGLPLRPAFGRGEPLLRHLGVGVGCGGRRRCFRFGFRTLVMGR